MSLERQQPEIKKPTSDIRSPSTKIENLFRQRNIKIDYFIHGTSFNGGPQDLRSYTRALWSFAASVIDTLIIVSLSCFFLVAFALVVHTNLQDTLLFFDGSFMIFSEIVFVVLSMIYSILLRSFLGYSVGEWACGLRLGLPKERLSRRYSLRVILRTLVIFGTGIVVLPLASLVTGHDMAGRISGIYLVKI